MRRLAHQRTGEGSRPLVLLHGFLGSARNLSTLARALVERDPDLGIVAFDLTGHGASPPLPPGADSATLAGDVLASAHALGLPTPLTLVGHSLGGRIALRAALLEPANVRVRHVVRRAAADLVDRIGATPLDGGPQILGADLVVERRQRPAVDAPAV